jgi:protein tyrosine phosphatase (PTP) superfamily phosphohydrolase (DUF442 family)
MLKRIQTGWRSWDRKWRADWAQDLSKPGARQRARFDMNVLDHGFLRRFWSNRYQIAPGVFRSNQPGPSTIEALAREGIRTIVNLRGASDWGSYLLEAEACVSAGIELIDHRLRSRRAPEPQEVTDLLDIFERIEGPFLMHCKSGADRAGLGAAIYLLGQGEQPETAAKQLSLRYLHISAAKTGILDAFIERYAQHHAQTGMGFREWTEQVYDHQALDRDFRATGPASFLVDRILRRE